MTTPTDPVVVVLTGTREDAEFAVATLQTFKHPLVVRLVESVRRALAGEGVRGWWAVFLHDDKIAPLLMRDYEIAASMNKNNPVIYNPPRRVLVVEVPDGE